jgi:hypothetical protein
MAVSMANGLVVVVVVVNGLVSSNDTPESVVAAVLVAKYYMPGADRTVPCTTHHTRHHARRTS